MNNLIQLIGKERQRYCIEESKYPQTMAVDYDDGVDLLRHFAKVCADKPQREKLSLMITKGDRAEIVKELNGMMVFGMKLTVVDIIFDSCATDEAG